MIFRDRLVVTMPEVEADGFTLNQDTLNRDFDQKILNVEFIIYSLSSLYLLLGNN